MTSAFHASVLLFTMNFVITLKVMTKLIVYNRTDALKTDVHLFFTITNCQIVRSRSLPHRITELQIHVTVRLMTIKISQWLRENLCCYRKTLNWLLSRALYLERRLKVTIKYLFCFVCVSDSGWEWWGDGNCKLQWSVPCMEYQLGGKK